MTELKNTTWISKQTPKRLLDNSCTQGASSLRGERNDSPACANYKDSFWKVIFKGADFFSCIMNSREPETICEPHAYEVSLAAKRHTAIKQLFIA